EQRARDVLGELCGRTLRAGARRARHRALRRSGVSQSRSGAGAERDEERLHRVDDGHGGEGGRGLKRIEEPRLGLSCVGRPDFGDDGEPPFLHQHDRHAVADDQFPGGQRERPGRAIRREPDPVMREGRRLPSVVWPLVALAVAIVPIAGVFTRSRLFFVRDLTMAFWPRFLFLRHSFASGAIPLWDPYTAHGQPAINDALYQLFHLPSLPIRLWLPEVPAFNIWVALPVPLAALGMYGFLRRQVTPPAAAVGSIAFAIAGPIVSSTNFPNMSWSICAVPFVFWALERVFERRSAASAALVALVVALQAL